jgi:hypothetical protein
MPRQANFSFHEIGCQLSMTKSMSWGLVARGDAFRPTWKGLRSGLGEGAGGRAISSQQSRSNLLTAQSGHHGDRTTSRLLAPTLPLLRAIPAKLSYSPSSGVRLTRFLAGFFESLLQNSDRPSTPHPSAP